MFSAPPAAHHVPFREALRTWTMVGLQSFGGPAGQIAVMHRIIVDEKKWISETRFLHALNYCMLLPGPEATQLATYIGWLMHRTIGGIMAGVLFVLPGFVSILALSILYAGFRDVSFVEGIFFGLKPAVLAVVVHALIRIGKRALRNRAMYTIAVLAFIAMYFFNAPFPLVIITAALIGFFGGRFTPRFFPMTTHGGAAHGDDDSLLGDSIPQHIRPTPARTVRTALVWLALWFVPIVVLYIALGQENIYFKQATFFSSAAVVTFGGAYSVLAYVAQQAVEIYHWLEPGEMLDGLGMAETTPGPLIQVVQFVGFMGAFREPGLLNPFLAGTLASILVTWVTFIPCFLWIFLGGPYIESLRGNRALNSALTAITAAVVGVILNLAVWFAVHTLFDRVIEYERSGIDTTAPDVRTVDFAAAIICIIAMFLLFRLRWNMLTTLAVCAGLGAVWVMFFV